MSNLVLHVKKKYFDQIKSGEKTEEYRLVKPYWSNRFSDDKPIPENIIIYSAYPSRSDLDLESKVLIFPFKGIAEKEITHPEFGDEPVWVFAIKLQKGDKNGKT